MKAERKIKKSHALYEEISLNFTAYTHYDFSAAAAPWNTTQLLQETANFVQLK